MRVDAEVYSDGSHILDHSSSSSLYSLLPSSEVASLALFERERLYSGNVATFPISMANYKCLPVPLSPSLLSCCSAHRFFHSTPFQSLVFHVSSSLFHLSSLSFSVFSFFFSHFFSQFSSYSSVRFFVDSLPISPFLSISHSFCVLDRLDPLSGMNQPSPLLPLPLFLSSSVPGARNEEREMLSICHNSSLPLIDRRLRVIDPSIPFLPLLLPISQLPFFWLSVRVSVNC